MPERLKDKRRPFIFNLADVLISPNETPIRDIYDDADVYLFSRPKKDPNPKKKGKNDGII